MSCVRNDTDCTKDLESLHISANPTRKSAHSYRPRNPERTPPRWQDGLPREDMTPQAALLSVQPAMRNRGDRQKAIQHFIVQY